MKTERDQDRQRGDHHGCPGAQVVRHGRHGGDDQGSHRGDEDHVREVDLQRIPSEVLDGRRYQWNPGDPSRDGESCDHRAEPDQDLQRRKPGQAERRHDRAQQCHHSNRGQEHRDPRPLHRLSQPRLAVHPEQEEHEVHADALPAERQERHGEGDHRQGCCSGNLPTWRDSTVKQFRQDEERDQRVQEPQARAGHDGRDQQEQQACLLGPFIHRDSREIREPQESPQQESPHQQAQPGRPQLPPGSAHHRPCEDPGGGKEQGHPEHLQRLANLPQGRGFHAHLRHKQQRVVQNDQDDSDSLGNVNPLDSNLGVTHGPPSEQRQNVRS